MNIKWSFLLITLGVALILTGGVDAVELKTSVPAQARSGKPAAKPWSEIEPLSGMIFVPLPGGTFLMGCGPWAEECHDEEKPVHEVRIDKFDMGRYQVTQQQWRAVMGSAPPDLYFKDCGPDCPVEGISWEETQDFIARLNKRSGYGCRYRLPTEAEWEYACRSGGRLETYCGGNDVDAVAWYQGNSGGRVHPVGQKKPNAFGLYDMSGNVWEWVNDWYGSDYYMDSPRHHPTGPATGMAQTIRGGSWINGSAALRSSFRDGAASTRSGNALGFRLARTCP
ncbi:MAG: formylglycine-generating enzyme family protein [Magnetococcales bacterium]|nr:formylglycine-generating enzyme family protein [Magnetococcales bacterium]